MSNDEPLYLRPNVQVEPLIDQWYAWSHLIPPATAARNITERHLKIMDSYIASPMIHAAAVKNPKMMGGPFIDYDGKRADEVRALRTRIRRERAHLIELSAALQSLDETLQSAAKGFSLHPLYQKVPEVLRGYVELAYDLNNHPSFRLIEPLLYKSRFYDRSQQSLMLSEISTDDRPFALSTPRLESDAPARGMKSGRCCKFGIRRMICSVRCSLPRRRRAMLPIGGQASAGDILAMPAS